MMMKNITSAMSNPEIISELGRRFKEYRLGLMRAVGCLEQVDELLPEIPISAYAIDRLLANKPKRIRHGK